MSTEQWIRELMQSGELWKFYKSREWKRLKAQVLRDHHYECAECRKRGVITRYDEGGRILSTVHHVCHVRDHPELALSRYYKNYATGKRNGRRTGPALPLKELLRLQTQSIWKM